MVIIQIRYQRRNSFDRFESVDFHRSRQDHDNRRIQSVCDVATEEEPFFDRSATASHEQDPTN